MRVNKRTHRPDWRRVKTHRSYTVEEAAYVLHVAKGTVRLWVKNGLPALKEQKPMLIIGSDLIAFGKSRRALKQKCEPHQCYCVKCRAPREPFEQLAEYVPVTATSGLLRGLCPICETMMHKRVSLAQLATLNGTLDISTPQGETHLIDSAYPSQNDHLNMERKTHGKASSGE